MQLRSLLWRAARDSRETPEKEELTKTRKDMRHSIVAHFQFVVEGEEGNVCEGIVVNISKHGFGFLTESVLKEGEVIRVTDHDLRNIVGCRARIEWVEKGPRHYRAGAKFGASR